MILKTPEKADRFLSNMTSIGISYYGGGDIVHTLRLCKNGEMMGSTTYKIYNKLYTEAIKDKHSPEFVSVIEGVLAQVGTYHARHAGERPEYMPAMQGAVTELPKL